jgi:hypothetical protein
MAAAIKGNALKYHNSQHRKSDLLDHVDEKISEYRRESNTKM